MTAEIASNKLTRAILRVVEPPVFKYRRFTLGLLTLLTVFFMFQASQLKPNAGWLKMVPKEHPYMQTFMEYYKDFGGANTVLIALHNKKGDIYQPEFMETLRKVEEDVFNVQGVDRARVTSIFSPSILYVEVVEGGLSGENVIPSDYTPTPEMMERIRINVGKASVIGRLVSEDQESALVQFELLEHDPNSGTTADLEEMSKPMSERLRAAWSSGARPGELPPEGGPSFGQRIKAVSGILLANQPGEGEASLDYVKIGEKLEEIRQKYESENTSIHIVGFAKVVHDMTSESYKVAGFFFIALIVMGALLWIYLGSLPLALIVVSTSFVSCIWEMGLLNLVGYGLDPFAMLVPFLIMAVSVSHGVQYVSSWANEISTRNASSHQASLATFRSLAIPGLVALLTNVVGFLTIYLINIQIIREMAINAALGMVGVIMVNKVLLPAVLSFIKLPNLAAFRIATEKRERIGDSIFKKMTVFCRRKPAIITITISVLLGLYGASQYHNVQIGDTTDGVPELKPDSRFNQDAAEVARHFTMGVDHLKVIAESFDNGCVDYGVMSELDRFSWYMKNQPGVRDVLSLPELAKIANSGLSEGRLDAEVLPRAPQSLAQSTALVPPTSGFLNDTCSALALFIFTTDHKAKTIDDLTNAVKAYVKDTQHDHRVKFRLASGNIGVMAATNEEVKRNELPVIAYVYVVIVIFLWLSFRTLSGVLCVIIPLSVVTALGYAVMVWMGIGQKVATLPVLAFACGIGVDYGIYSYSVIAAGLRKGMTLEDAYYQKMRSTGKATLFTGVGLASGVALWLFSGLQFQRDMGVLLLFGFTANMIGAIVVLPALAHFLGKEELKYAGHDLTLGADDALAEEDDKKKS